MSVNIVVPEVGESIVDARVAKWLKQEGDTVAAGDPLVELETDKIDLEVAAPQAGVLTRIDRKDGDDVKVGEVLGILEAAAGAEPGAAAGEPSERAEAPAGDGQPAGGGSAASKTRATPAARKVAEQKDVDLAAVKGSGDAGRVMRRDVEATIAPAGAAATPSEAKPASSRPATPPSGASTTSQPVGRSDQNGCHTRSARVDWIRCSRTSGSQRR